MRTVSGALPLAGYYTRRYPSIGNKARVNILVHGPELVHARPIARASCHGDLLLTCVIMASEYCTSMQ